MGQQDPERDPDNQQEALTNLDDTDQYMPRQENSIDHNGRPRRKSAASSKYSLRDTRTQDNSSRRNYSLRKKGNVDYSVYYMPSKSKLKQIEESTSYSRHSLRNMRSPGKRRRMRYGSSDDEFTGFNNRDSAQSLSRQPSAQVRSLAPVNMVDLVRNQQVHLISLLPEEERSEYTKDKTDSLGDSSKNTEIPVETFDNIGGLQEHVKSLKEMVAMPLMYPEIFEKFKITPPKGVLFYGPPGTGKTMMGEIFFSFKLMLKQGHWPLLAPHPQRKWPFLSEKVRIS